MPAAVICAPNVDPISVTGPGKLTVGKLYGGIIIYEIWKTTRFSNLEILAKMEMEMAAKMAKNTDDGGNEQTENSSEFLQKRESSELNGKINGEVLDEYDRFDEDHNYHNRQRDYYQTR